MATPCTYAFLSSPPASAPPARPPWLDTPDGQAAQKLLVRRDGGNWEDFFINMQVSTSAQSKKKLFSRDGPVLYSYVSPRSLRLLFAACRHSGHRHALAHHLDLQARPCRVKFLASVGEYFQGRAKRRILLVTLHLCASECTTARESLYTACAKFPSGMLYHMLAASLSFALLGLELDS